MAIIRTADRPLNEPHKKPQEGRSRRFTRAVIAAAAASAAIATSGFTATASAATKPIPVLYNSNFAGYHTALSDTSRFRYVATTGIRGTLLRPWTTVSEIDGTSARSTVIYPGPLSSGGASFGTYLHAAS